MKKNGGEIIRGGEVQGEGTGVGACVGAGE